MSRAPSPHGTTPRASTASQSAPASSAMHMSSHAVLAGVAGAVDHHLDAVDRRLRERERVRRRQSEPLDRARALHGDERVLVGDVAHVGAGDLARLQPLEVGLAVRGVDDEQVGALVEPVDDEVVDDAAVARSSAACTAPRRAAMRSRSFESADWRRSRARGPSTSNSPMCETSNDAGVGPHGAMLLDHARVLHRHLPARERDELRAERDVPVVQRRAGEASRAARRS